MLLKWARRFGDRRWAIEKAIGLGCHLAQWLVAREKIVVDIATTATARVRELSRGGRCKNDVIDAAAAASIAAFYGDATEVTPNDETAVFALLEERRVNVAAQRVRTVNQLHALLRDLVPGGARTNLSAAVATGPLRSIRPATGIERTRKELARDIVRDIRGLYAALADIASRMSEALGNRDTRLLEVDGVGPVLAVRLIDRTG